jgi:hypothetical protein
MRMGAESIEVLAREPLVKLHFPAQALPCVLPGLLARLCVVQCESERWDQKGGLPGMGIWRGDSDAKQAREQPNGRQRIGKAANGFRKFFDSWLLADPLLELSRSQSRQSGSNR